MRIKRSGLSPQTYISEVIRVMTEPEDEDCSHNVLQYEDMNVCDPEVIYENWTCQVCGASVKMVYKPSHAVVDPKDDDRESYRTKEVIP